MELSGFLRVPGAQTYHHTPGKVRGYTELDRGQKSSVRDEDPREGFVSYGNNQVMLGTEPGQPYSYTSKFQRGAELTLVREWAGQDRSGYQQLEVRRSELGTVSAEISTIEDGEYRRYRADDTTANSLLASMESEFNSAWNLAQ